MARVFISYSRKDIDFAKRLTGELQKSELDFWIDWEGIPPTVDWWREIEKGIEESDAFLFIISPDSVNSKVCRQEIDHAVQNGKRLIPLVVREIEAGNVHQKLTTLNWIFFRTTDDFDTSINKLLTSIHTDFDWVEVQRRLQVRALEWERNHKEKSFLLRGKDLGDAESQLVTNSSKEPYPTNLQREYIFESRKATDNQRRVVTSISIAGIVALAALAVFGFYQAGQSANNAATAQANFIAAETARVDSQNKQVLADNSAATAIANEQEVIRQAKIAFARQLASQALSTNIALDSKQMVAALLDIQSMKIYPNGDAASFLINNNHAALQTARMTHEDDVTTVAFSPDGKHIVSGSADNTARVWDAETGMEIAKMTHSADVSSVAFSPDGKYVVSGSRDSTARVWDAISGEEISRVTHDDLSPIDRRDVYVTFSPDGKYVVSASGNTALVFDAYTGSEIARMAHKVTSLVSNITFVTFSLDGKYVVSGDFDGIARVWNATNGKLVAQMIHYNDSMSSLQSYVYSVVFSPDDKYIATACGDGTVRIWETTSWKEIARLQHDSSVKSVAFSSNGKYVVSGSYDNTARVWSMSTWREVSRITNESDVVSVDISPNSRYAVLGSVDGTARVWEVTTGMEIARMTHDDAVRSVAFSPDGKFVASGSYDDTARIWEAVPIKEVVYVPYEETVTYADISPNGKYIARRDNRSERIIHVTEEETKKEVANLSHDGKVLSVAFSPDAMFFASGDDENIVRVWETTSWQEVAHIALDSDVKAVAFSPDNKYVVTGDADGIARVWDVATSKEVSRIVHNDDVISIAFSPDGMYVISGSFDYTARVWDAATGKEISRMTHDSYVPAVAFSPDGKYVISGGADNTARVWEAGTGVEIARIIRDGSFKYVNFSPDGKYAISDSYGKTTYKWEWRAKDLIANACAVMPRNLTRAEWQQYIGDALPYQAVCENLPIEPEVTITATP